MLKIPFLCLILVNSYLYSMKSLEEFTPRASQEPSSKVPPLMHLILSQYCSAIRQGHQGASFALLKAAYAGVEAGAAIPLKI